MEILINELSLTGQFQDENEFLDNFDLILKKIKLIDSLNFSILKEYMFFNSSVTNSHKLCDFLKLRTDRVKRMKRFLAKLTENPPFWNDTQKHDCSQSAYTYKDKDICETSLAESCERDRTVLSFHHNDFLDIDLDIYKNRELIKIYNFIEEDKFLEYLLAHQKIVPIIYCNLKFKNSNLSFSELESRYGFDLLETPQQIDEFIKAFIQFSQTNWQDIQSSDGFQYKKYNGNEFGSQDIYKFRVTQKYRCFGYRSEDVFYILRFEITHKISDKG